MNYIKITKGDQIFYFSSKRRAAKYIGVAEQNMNKYIGGYKAKGWTVCEVDETEIDIDLLNPTGEVVKESKLSFNLFKIINKL